MRGISPILTMVVLMLIAIVGFTMVLGIGIPLIDTSEQLTKFKNAESSAKLIDNAINGVVTEGTGAVRVVDLVASPEFVSIPKENSFEFTLTATSELLEHLTRRFSGNIAYISGSDVTCRDNGRNITMENGRVKAVFQKILETSPYSSIDTSRNILELQEKNVDVTVSIANSSIVLNDDLATSSGIGYSEILRTGESLPSCTTHFFINSTVDNYDIYYTLYSGADFFVIDIRNVR